MGEKVKSNIEFIFHITFFLFLPIIFNSINENVQKKKKKIHSVFHVVKSPFIPFKLLAIQEVV